MLANQVRPTSLSAAIVFRVHPFLAKKHRELPFLVLAIAREKSTKMKRIFVGKLSVTEISQ